MNTVNQGVRKLDAMQLVTWQPVYTEDSAPVSYTHLPSGVRTPHPLQRGL